MPKKKFLDGDCLAEFVVKFLPGFPTGFPSRVPKQASQQGPQEIFQQSSQHIFLQWLKAWGLQPLVNVSGHVGVALRWIPTGSQQGSQSIPDLGSQVSNSQ